MKKIIILLLSVSLLFGCVTTGNNVEDGTRRGVAIGALAGAVLGQALGGDTGATLLGAGLGALAGGVIGNKYGKQADEQEAALRKQLAAIKDANVQRNADILSITFGSDMLFDSGSAQLKPGAVQEIRRVGTILNQYTDTKIRVDGHTDNTGTAAFNQTLSELRATNVKLSFTEQGVHPSRIRTIGFGASTPLAQNNTETGRRLNRRVVITISPNQA
jgi:outer membrane protein OmpA-like peptidoglycan-associated protein